MNAAYRLATFSLNSGCERPDMSLMSFADDVAMAFYACLSRDLSTDVTGIQM
jgi:hypothetical protein